MTIRWAIVALMMNVGVVLAQPTSAPADNQLGEKFESLAAGISLQPPADMKEIRGPIGSNEVVRFVNEDKQWIMKVTRVLIEPGHPVPLTNTKDKDGHDQPGMLETTVAQFQHDTPGAEILRQDVINIGDAQVGMMAAKYNFSTQTNLTQEAIIRGGDFQYYFLALTSPAPRQGDVAEDPTVREAVHAFSQSLDTVKLLDQSQLKEDRDARLFNTWMFYVNLNEKKLRETLVPERWLRIVRDGKDIGYTYVVEEISRDLPRKGKPERLGDSEEGVLVGQRSRVIPDQGVQIDSENWYFCTFSRNYEAWSNLIYTTNAKGVKNSNIELGISRRRDKPVADPSTDIGKKKTVNLTEEYRLEVTKFGMNEPIVRDLPPTYYLPQAFEQLLPRLLPLRQPQTFAFLSWVNEANNLMLRYIDVGDVQDVNLGGQHVQAIPVKDRIGIEGPATTDYISPDGKFLGSVNDETHITILPSDAATLAKIWGNADLSRPGAVDDAK